MIKEKFEILKKELVNKEVFIAYNADEYNNIIKFSVEDFLKGFSKLYVKNYFWNYCSKLTIDDLDGDIQFQTRDDATAGDLVNNLIFNIVKKHMIIEVYREMEIRGR